MGYLNNKELPSGFSESLSFNMIDEVQEYIINNFKNLKENNVMSIDKETFLKKFKE